MRREEEEKRRRKEDQRYGNYDFGMDSSKELCMILYGNYLGMDC